MIPAMLQIIMTWKHIFEEKLQLKRKTSSQLSLLFRQIVQTENSVFVSYLTAEKAAKCGKPFVKENL
jgi:hypothetical protein